MNVRALDTMITTRFVNSQFHRSPLTSRFLSFPWLILDPRSPPIVLAVRHGVVAMASSRWVHHAPRCLCPSMHPLRSSTLVRRVVQTRRGTKESRLLEFRSLIADRGAVQTHDCTQLLFPYDPRFSLVPLCRYRPRDVCSAHRYANFPSDAGRPILKKRIIL